MKLAPWYTSISILFFLGGYSAHAKKVKIEWKSIEGAIQYEIKIQDGGRVVLKKGLDDSYWKGDLPFGAYSYQIRGIDEAKRPGIWTEPRSLVVMPPPPKPKYPPDGSKVELYNPNLPIQLKWEESPGISQYAVELKRDGINVSKTTVNSNQITLNQLPPGKYSWSVKGIIQTSHRSLASVDQKKWETEAKGGDFKIEHKNLDLPELVKPIGTIAPPEDGKIKFKWKTVEGAEAYELHLIRSNRGVQDRTLANSFDQAKRFATRDNSITLQLPGEGAYSWRVRGLANLDEKQVPHAVGSGAIAQFNVDRNAIFRGDLGYLAFSLMFAPYNYQIKSPSNGIQGSTQSSLLDFRVSGEYIMHPQWAISTGIDLAQFQILNQAFSRKAFELHMKYRMKFGTSEYSWYFSPKLGAELREYNQIIPSDSSNISAGVRANSIYAMGPSVGFDLRKQFSRSFSLGIKASYFKPISMIGGVESGQVSGSASGRNSNFGIQGLYWLNKTWGAGLGGYFEMRSLGFVNSSSPNQEEIFMDGSYFFGSIVYRIWK
jgi:hypothetical protein